jgi:hypothetical protein
MSTLLRDGFGRTVSNGLGVPAYGAAWTSVSGVDGTDKLALWDVGSGNATLSPGDAVLALAGTVEAGACEVLVSITSMDAACIGGAVVLGLDTPAGIIAYYDKAAGGINLTSDSLSITMLTKAVTFPIWLRLRWADGQAQARVWNDGATEPTTWDVEMTLASTGPGQCGLYGQASTGQAVVFGSVEASTVSPWLASRAQSILHDTATTDTTQLTTDAQYSAAVDAALAEYSRLFPVVTTHTETLADGEYEWTLPADWVSGFSSMQSVEYPSGSQEPVYLGADDYMVTSTKWRMLHDTADASETAILTYTALHTESSVPSSDTEAVAMLAAAVVALEVAAGFARTNRPVVAADSVDYRTKSDEWRSLARQLRSGAFALMGGSVDSNGRVKQPGASATALWEFDRP